MTRRTHIATATGICLNRQESPSGRHKVCTAPGRIGRCPGWYATGCIVCDMLRAAAFVLWRPIRKMFFTV
jgi:hypothetical protein